MQFQVPQFIEVEDKIIGPLTFRQFVFIAGGFGMAYVFWRLLPIFLSGPLIIGVGALAASLAFFQYNGRPFIVGLENGFYYYLHTKLYLWNNTRKKKVAKKTQDIITPRGDVYIPKISDSKLHELAWSLDIKERIAAGTESSSERILRGEDVMAPVHTPQDMLAHLKQDAIAQ